MIISCPHCSTQYAVPSTAIPPQGKKVKCTTCQHLWMQRPLEAMMDTTVLAPPPDKIEPIPDYSSLPVPQQPSSSLAHKVIFAFFALFALLSWALSSHTMFPSLEEILGMDNTDGVIFSNFVAEKDTEGAKLKFNISGDIVNTTNTLKPLGIIRIRVLSKGGNEMGKLDFPPEVDSLMPGEVYHITPAIDNISGNADVLVLDMGNQWEMLFR